MLDNNTIKAIYGNIIYSKAEVIFNSANPMLCGAAGVSAAIHTAAGPELDDYCKRLPGCDVGNAVITPGFKLCKYIVHVVVPKEWKGGLFTRAVTQGLDLARQTGAQSLALPVPGVGIHGLPKRKAVSVLLDVLGLFCQGNPKFKKIAVYSLDNEVIKILSDKTSKD